MLSVSDWTTQGKRLLFFEGLVHLLPSIYGAGFLAQNAHSNHLALPPLPWRRAEVALELAPQVQQAGQTDPDKRQYLRFDGCMKTTVDLPEALLVKAKILAAEQRTTLRDLVVEGLKRVTESRNEDTKKHVSPP